MPNNPYRGGVILEDILAKTVAYWSVARMVKVVSYFVQGTLVGDDSLTG
jgi:hypothetical protein